MPDPVLSKPTSVLGPASGFAKQLPAVIAEEQCGLAIRERECPRANRSNERLNPTA